MSSPLHAYPTAHRDAWGIFAHPGREDARGDLDGSGLPTQVGAKGASENNIAKWAAWCILSGRKEQDTIAGRYARVAGPLDERGRRAVAAAAALALGWGGSSAVARATGLSRDAIRAGIRELRGLVPVAAPGRIRRPGGGRKKTVERDPTVVADLERLVAPATRGDPMSPLRWTSKSVRKLAAALGAAGHRVSHQWVAEALRAL